MEATTSEDGLARVGLDGGPDWMCAFVDECESCAGDFVWKAVIKLVRD